MKKIKRKLAGLLVFMLVFTMMPQTALAAKKKVKLSKRNVTVTVGKTFKLKLRNNKKKVKWTVVSGKKNVTLSKKKKTGVTIKGKKPGTAKVQAKVGKKKYVSKCVSKYHTTANEGAGQNYASTGCDTGTNGKTGKVLSGALCGRSGICHQFCLF